MRLISISSQNKPIAIVRGGWLDALRFIVASLIILHHFQMSAPIPLAEGLHPAFEHTGFLLTNFFLIDSGYVLMRVYGKALTTQRLSPSDFFLKRFLRVIPAHLLVLFGLVALVLVATAAGVPPSNPEFFSWDQLPAQIFLLQSFGVPGGWGWNAPTWSISALLGCYVAFPLVLRGLQGLGPWTALGLVVVGYLAANEIARAVFGYPVYQMPLNLGIWRALPLFVLGMGLAWFAQGVWIKPQFAKIVGIAAAIGFAIAQYYGKNALISLVFISLIILAAGAIPTPKPSRLIEQVAMVSFAMFISNEVVRIAWFGLADAVADKMGWGEMIRWALWGMGVLAAFVFAFGLHYLIDQPIQNRIRKWLKARGVAKANQPVVSLEG